jgi:hypothetical protein
LLDEDFTTLLLKPSSFTEELLLSPRTELEDFLVAVEELDSFAISTDEEDSSLGSEAGAELLDSLPQATNKIAETNNAAKCFIKPPITTKEPLLPNLNYKKRNAIRHFESV